MSFGIARGHRTIARFRIDHNGHRDVIIDGITISMMGPLCCWVIVKIFPIDIIIQRKFEYADPQFPKGLTRYVKDHLRMWMLHNDIGRKSKILKKGKITMGNNV